VKTKLWLLGLVAFGAYLVSSALVSVKESELVVIAQFGRPIKVIQDAGLTLKWPDPIQTAKTLDKRLQLLSLDPHEFVTRDRRNLVISPFVLWKVVDPETFLASVRNTETAELRLASLVYSQIGAAIANQPIQNVFTTEATTHSMDTIFEGVTSAANTTSVQEFGIDVVAVRPARFGFPKQNLLAIYKRMESERDRVARQYRAEGQEEAARIDAQTEREVRELRARASREAQVIQGEAEAEAARIYAQAYEANPGYYKFMRTMEAYEKMLSKKTSLVLSSDAPLFRMLLTPPGDSQP
jgi:membrane protease subunit HflC